MRPEKKGLSSMIGARGKLWLEHAIKEGKVLLGNDVLTSILHKHTILSIDLGVDNELTVTIISAKDTPEGIKSVAAPYSFPTAMRYRDAGIDARIRERQTNANKESEAALSKDHGRTGDPEKYKTHMDTFDEYGWALLLENFSDENLQLTAELENRKRSYLCGVASMMLALADAMEEGNGRQREGAPIILMGNPKFSGTMRRKRPAAPKALVEYLQRFFAVIMIDEHNTSKLCSGCDKELTLVDTKSFRIWRCDNGCKNTKGKALVVNKDVSAGLNFFKIFTHLMVHGERPAPFCPKNKN